ncbi:hypothetical protein H2198_008818 [Neophaeococcomyces mojaviensis]|uniref:Uncharacterized protein n=1 Tax=Neophaeococcomyces mojaviensis TaxID=3383035 RepID=A0ACC2ZWD1_9EURO|nr:hypothetical protein H2198_008818 [Knufia sp. JES_112]
MLPFYMSQDGFILSDDDLKRYNGHHQIDKYYLPEGADKPTISTVERGTNVEELKQWLRPTKISEDDVDRWKATPALKILLIKTQNQFSRNPENNPSHRTIPGQTEVIPLPGREIQIEMVKEIFWHAKLPLAALGAYIKAHITFSSSPSYEVFGERGICGGDVSSYYCSGTSWSIAWSYFHETRHTAAVMFYREGDGVLRRNELEQEILRLKQHITHPLLLAYIKTQVSLLWTFHLLEQMNGQTFEIEKSLGLAAWDWVLDREIEAYRDPDITDDDSEVVIARAQKQAVERYNVLSGKLTNIRFRLRSFREQIIWLRRSNQAYLMSLKGGHRLEARKRECIELDAMLDRMDDFNKIYLHDADTLTERLSQQMSSMRDMITQRDSRISLAIADINNELAWQGKNTNSAMMAIAVASFIFLPSTFIASVFDTPIFNWQPTNTSSIIAEPFWIFWTTCGLTTLVMFLFWILYIKIRNAVARIRRKEARQKFRRKILRTPTLLVRTSRSGPSIEVGSEERSWLWFWHSRVGGTDEEKGIGALKAASFEKSDLK